MNLKQNLRCTAWGLVTLLAWTNSTEGANSVNFAEHIAPVIHAKCSKCHRAGQAGPFELLTYDDVRRRALTIQAAVHDNYMPPWKPVNNNVDFANDRRLSTAEKRQIDQWIESGMPAGDLRQVKPPVYSSRWALGEPDMVLKMSDRFRVPASGPDIYRSFVFRLSLPDDKWVKAVELRPTARGAVHHALFFVDTTGEARRRDAEDGRPGLSGMQFLRPQRPQQSGQRGGSRGAAIKGLGGYVPGAMPNRLPGDLAMHLPAGGDIVMQTHFHPTGKEEWEQSELALYFADKPPTRQIVPVQLPALFGRFSGIDVPAGESSFEIRSSFVLPVDVEAIQIGGHAHYICKEMELTATLPSGKKMPLMTIQDWDLDWQDQYQFKEPLSLPAGTRLDGRLMYDNSAENPNNPHSPPQRIRWGRESTDEMGSVTLQMVAKSSADEQRLQQAYRDHVIASLKSGIGNELADGAKRFQGRWAERPRGTQQSAGRLVKQLDRNGNGKLESAEIPERLRERVLAFADKNKDGVLDARELEQAKEAFSGFMRRGAKQ